MWITSEPLKVEHAKAALKEVVKNLDHFIKKGQIEILDYSEWYTKSGKFDANNVLQGWVEKENQALKRGYDGLRLSGNTFWLAERDWRNFTDYEEEVNNVISKYRMIAICTYSLGQCGASEVIDVVSNHQFALIRREGKWVIIENSERAEKALREGETKYRLLIENLNEGVWQIDEDACTTFVNPRMAEMLGYTVDEMLGKHLFEFMDERGVEIAQYNLERRQQGIKEQHDFEFIRKDGSRIYTILETAPIADENGHYIGAIAGVQNITERKRVEEALEKSAQLLRDTGEMAKVGGWELDLSTKEVLWTEEVVRIHGVEPGYKPKLEEAVNFFAPESRPALEEAIKKAAETGEPYDLELLFIPSGSKDKIWVRSIGRAVYSGDKIVKLTGTFQSIDKYKRVGERLRESEERYRSVFNNAFVGMAIVNPEGHVVEANETFSRFLGYSREELIGRHFTEFTHPEDMSIDSDLYAALLDDERLSYSIDKRYLLKGKVVWGRLSVSLIKDEAGQLENTVVVREDITDRKRAEEEMRLLQEQFLHSQKMEAMGRLAGGITHDFNNLLTVIRGYSELCLEKLEKPDPLRRKVEGIQRASERASRLTNQLLAFSRHQVMEMKVINLKKLFKDIGGMLRRVIGEDIELVTILAEDMGGVKVDPGQMEQVIMNLAVNARDAMPNGGKLTIEAKNVESDDVFFESHVGGEPGRYVMFSVSDMGFGMTPEVREHLFEPFFTTKEKGKGTGLGLSTAYGIVKQSGGEITVESEVGKGSAFRIYLPLVEGAMEDQKEEEQGVWGGKETVLVVEDDEEVRRLMVEVLEGQGYRVLEASGGEEALGMVEEYEGRIDLLLTDVVMQGMNGRELGKRFVERREMVKILYMSGFADDERVPWNVLEEGMNYIQKPFTIDMLTRKVREVLDK
jgi:PAS domain S-box-containing protein